MFLKLFHKYNYEDYFQHILFSCSQYILYNLVSHPSSLRFLLLLPWFQKILVLALLPNIL